MAQKRVGVSEVRVDLYRSLEKADCHVMFLSNATEANVRLLISDPTQIESESSVITRLKPH